MQGSTESRALRLDVKHLEQPLEVLSFSGFDAIDQPFALQLQVLSHQGELDTRTLLFSSAYFNLSAPGLGYHGQIQRIVRVAPGRYQMTLGARLACLGHRYNQRVFQDVSAEAIMRELLREHGIHKSSYAIDLTRATGEREYCAQYQESDLQLLQRLCVEEGIHFYFSHTRFNHVLRFTDDIEELSAGRHAWQSRRKAFPEQLSCDSTASPSPLRRADTQRAWVVGRLFEEARRDERNRIEVRFDWGHQGTGSLYNDCWLRIAEHMDQQPGQWWGGMEVLVSFVQGDADRPLITGSLVDPHINPQTSPAAAPGSGVPLAKRSAEPLLKSTISTRVGRRWLLGESNTLQVGDMVVDLPTDQTMRLSVGDSDVIIEADTVLLRSPQIVMCTEDRDGIDEP
jgi:uncharacterized protein involved in type VI secretion and phage assembly